jgi:predicted esterase
MRIIILSLLLMLEASVSLAVNTTMYEFSYKHRDYVYYLCLPDNYNAENTYNALVVMHGAGDTGSNMARAFTPLVNNQWIVIAPQGSIEVQVSATRIGYVWVDWNQLETNKKYVEYGVMMAIDKVQQEQGVKLDKKIVFGFSMGATMAVYIGMFFADVFTGIYPHSGQWLNSIDAELCSKILNMPIYYSHGESDGTIPISYGQDLVDHLSGCGAKVFFKKYPHLDHDFPSNYATEFKTGIDWILANARPTEPKAITTTTWRNIKSQALK